MVQLVALATLSLVHLLDEPAIMVLLADGDDLHTDRILQCVSLGPHLCNVAMCSFTE